MPEVEERSVGHAWPADLGVVVVHYDNFPQILDTVQDIIASGAPPESLVVVDNSGSAALNDEFDLHFSGASLLRGQGNVGYGAGVNLGMRHLAEAGYVLGLVLTHEVKLAPGSVTALYKAMTDESGVAAVAPVVHLLSDPTCVWSAGGELDWHSFQPRARKGVGIDDPEWFDGCCFMTRVADFERWGGMYEPFFLYFEDVDFFLRIAAHGRLRLVPEARAFQEPGGMSLYYAVRNRLLLARRHGGLRPTARILCEHGMKSLVEAVLAVFLPSRRTKLALRVAGLAAGMRSAARTSRVEAGTPKVRGFVRRLIKSLLGKNAKSLAVWLAAKGPALLRKELLGALGVRNEGSVARGVVFANSNVRIEPGARVGGGCRFEGGAAITIRSGVVVAPHCVLTTRVGSTPDRDVDVPLVIASDMTNSRSALSPSRMSGGHPS